MSSTTTQNAVPTIVPTRPSTQWPVGVRLRFKPDAELHAQHATLKGTQVLVLSGLKLIGPSGPDLRCSWRQEILSFAAGCRVGWARPDQLELPLDEEEDAI
ncbi:MAG TPA: hypothetical protein VHE37_16835 [Nevskiaceae bacterium]|nr:hypothetical protein [Nevskiaceae bacterium]